MENLNVNVQDQKIKISSYVKINGPVVAQNIAKKMGLPSFLASALLSELLRDKIVKTSHLRVGGSPLYFVKGQEERLDGYTNFLAFKEREAFKMLKEKNVLEDVKLEPPIRVAFRNMKDFAVPLSVSQNGEERLFWKFHTLPTEEAQKIIGEALRKVSKPKKKVEKPKAEVVKKVEEKKQEIKGEQKTIVEAKPKKKKAPGKLPLKVQEWMAGEKVVMKEEIENEGKMFKAIVEVKSNIGNLDFFLVAINKKSVNEGDLALCYQEGSDRKLPILLLLNGKLSKKGQKVFDGMKGHVVLKKF